MKTKAEIIHKLLEDKHITVEEAMTLMMREENTVFVPYYPVNPYPFLPYSPTYPLPYKGRLQRWLV